MLVRKWNQLLPAIRHAQYDMINRIMYEFTLARAYRFIKSVVPWGLSLLITRQSHCPKVYRLKKNILLSVFPTNVEFA